ncbi:MAG: polymer-forming cytoskeletal protein [Campylobacterales bacterium]
MGRIFSNDKASNINSGTTTIAAGTKITGEIDIGCNLHIDGEFEGSVKSKSFITIGKDGIIEGDIEADKLIVSGKFYGTCECEIVEILPNGCIEGKIISKELVIERKGLFVGESNVKNRETPALEKRETIAKSETKGISKVESK